MNPLGFFTAALYLAFALGQFLRMLSRAYQARNSKENPITRYLDYFKIYSIPLLIRFFLCLALFAIYRTNPDLMTKIFSVVGVTVNWTLPLIPPVALGLGFAADLIIDQAIMRIPVIKDMIPSLDQVKAKVETFEIKEKP